MLSPTVVQMGHATVATPAATPGVHQMPELMLTKREAAQGLKVSERTFERILASGTGPKITRIGARVLIQVAHLLAWIDRCTGEAGAEKAAA